MKVTVLFFGATAEAVGAREIEMNLNADATSAAAFDVIKKEFPQLNAHSLLLAVNQEYSDGGELMKDGDELAVFTAVSGG